ncbi:MAG: winged helix-turn-helix domain-containing protein [Nitrososphaerales archaeon]
MKTVRRSKLERLIDILKVIADADSIRQTHVMYKANLTWDELKKDLQWLMSLELIERTTMSEGIFYRITSMGLDILSHFDKIESTLKLSLEKSPSSNLGSYVLEVP